MNRALAHGRPGMRGVSAMVLSGFALVLASSCTKETLPELPFDSPVFTVFGSAGQDSLMLEAGNNGYYMHTQGLLDPHGIEVYSGLLAQDPDAPRSALRLEIRSLNLPGSSLHSDQASLAGGSKPLFLHDRQTVIPGKYRVSFQMSYPAGVSSQQWSYGNGTFTTTFSPSTIFDESSQQQYPVRLSTLNSTLACGSAVTHYIDLSQEDCRGTLWIQPNTGSSLDVQSSVVQGGSASVEWSLDGQPYAQGSSCMLSLLSAGVHEICAEFVFQNGCRNIACRTLVIDNFGLWTGAACQNDFTYQIEALSVFDSLQTGAVRLRYFDEQGTEFSSDESSSASSFEILSSKPYLNDRNGNPTYEVEFSFEGVLRSQGGDSLQIAIPRGRMAVGALD